MSTTILDELGWRGLVAQSTDLDALAASGVRILDTRGRMAGLTVERL